MCGGGEARAGVELGMRRRRRVARNRCEALAASTCALERLNLSRNRLTNAIGASIEYVLKCRSTLKSLDVSWNALGADACESRLARFARKSSIGISLLGVERRRRRGRETHRRGARGESFADGIRPVEMSTRVRRVHGDQRGITDQRRARRRCGSITIRGRGRRAPLMSMRR